MCLYYFILSLYCKLFVFNNIINTSIKSYIFLNNFNFEFYKCYYQKDIKNNLDYYTSLKIFITITHKVYIVLRYTYTECSIFIKKCE